MVDQSGTLPGLHLPSRRDVRLARADLRVPTAQPEALNATTPNTISAPPPVPLPVHNQVPTNALIVEPAPPEATPHEPEKAPRSLLVRALNFIRESAIILVSALVVSWLIKTFLVQAFYIPSESMEHTLNVGDRVIVSRLVPRFMAVDRGDIVVFTDPGDWLGDYIPPDRGPLGNAVTTALTWVGLFPQDAGDHLIKRAIGIPGDNVACCDAYGRVSVNGVAISEQDYLMPGAVPSQDPFNVTVPPNMLFVMGDNRQNSADSRYNQDKPYGGFVPMDNVVGTAFVIVWPLNHTGWLRNPTAVFENVINH